MKLARNFKDFQGLKFLFWDSRTFKDFQGACEPCLQEILDEAAIDKETNHQTTKMEKKISHAEKHVKRIEENPVSKPFGRCGHKHTQI